MCQVLWVSFLCVCKCPIVLYMYLQFSFYLIEGPKQEIGIVIPVLQVWKLEISKKLIQIHTASNW